MLDFIYHYKVIKGISALTSVIGIFAQIIIVIIGLTWIWKKHEILAKILTGLAILLLAINIGVIIDGSFTERVIEEFGGKVYFGQTENGRANGFGILFDEDRNLIYTGDFRNNQYHGEGKQYKSLTENGETELYVSYKGGFENGEYSGKGSCYTYFGGERKPVYEGEFRSGKYNGRGVYFFYEEDSLRWKYDGCFAYGKYCGFGEFLEYDLETGEERKRYEGTYKSNERDGWGCSYEDGHLVYAGYWSEDAYHGSGSRYYTNRNGEGRRYETEFVDGEPSYDGTLYDWNGNEVQGEEVDISLFE